ncbi:MarR family transcriptional regulator [Actinomadura logoneensis]|uniref:MarR family transcriptional regulator n=1 Tax=Actinomadura logoneensis TaxID=2293572 RepID=A0A372JR30_9ACTN|nr:MarR family winged helix-turn-helix transcriptional regulator [Actinomadura logoneensis]RFU42472.1 MarR family transcriptional regulator [Actinomadura logoneensis]
MNREKADASRVRAAIEGVGPLARRLNQAHARLWHERVDQELTGPQFTVLSLLCTHGDMDQGTLGALAHLDKSTAAPLLDRLRRRGLVELAKDDADRRRKLVRVTPDGRALATRLAPQVIAVGDHLLSSLTPEEQRQFVALLAKVVAVPEG